VSGEHSHPILRRAARCRAACHSLAQKSICLLLSAAILNTLAIPLAQARKRQQKSLQELSLPGPAERYASGFDRLEQALPRTSTIPPALGPFTHAPAAYAAIRQQMAEQAQALRQDWAQLRHTWEQAGVQRDILARQQDVETAFESRHAQLMARLQAAIEHPGDAQAIAALQTFVQADRPRSSRVPIDLDKLPWQVEQARPHMPASTGAELQKPLAAAQQSPPAKTPISHRLALAMEEQESAANKAAQAKADAVPRAKSGPSPHAAADLAPTLDAPHTGEIKALAQSLGNNPHAIYQWVHDNIHYFPSHGSVQGAQDTLDKKRGNAFDTSSLLIALLRSAGIPARYVYGSVEIPSAQVQNWVGGVATANAAQQILSQGGVPNAILTRGGKDHAFRLEHVWVEALIQYHPGRGARHIPGTSKPDSWVPMDAGFKQYTHAAGMDLAAAVPFDAQALLDAARRGAEINEQEGWARNLDSAAIQTRLQSYQSQLQSYIGQQNGGNSTVGDVLGTKTAQIDPLPYFAGTLPYPITARLAQFSEIPNERRAQFQYAIYPDRRAAAWGDSPLLAWQAPTAAIAGKKVTLAWVPASDADRQAIEALIPTPPAGQALDPGQLPAGLPGSIRLKPEIRLDGQTVATGGTVRAGDEPTGVGGFTRYGTSQWDQWDSSTDALIAGQQTALGISIQGISAAQLDALKARMQATKTRLEQARAAAQSQREQILRGLTGESLSGDLLTATIWAYFASLQSYGAIAASQAQVIDLPGLQYGLFHAQVQPRKLYGLVTTGITFKGLNLDAGHVRSIRWVKDDNPRSPINSKPELTANGRTAAHNRWIAYNKSKGQYASAMEHATLEQLWVDKNTCRYTDENGTVQLRHAKEKVKNTVGLVWILNC